MATQKAYIYIYIADGFWKEEIKYVNIYTCKFMCVDTYYIELSELWVVAKRDNDLRLNMLNDYF